MWKKIFTVVSLGLVLLDNVTYGQLYGSIEGRDYPGLIAVPPTIQFTCANKLPGYYADIESRCQVWHWCLPSGHVYSFVCPVGTVFNQKVRVCDWWFNVHCPSSVELYGNNAELYRDANGNNI